MYGIIIHRRYADDVTGTGGFLTIEFDKATLPFLIRVDMRHGALVTGGKK